MSMWIRHLSSSLNGVTDEVLELKDKTLGLIGLGNIGKEVVKRAKAFDPKIIYFKRNRLSLEEVRARHI